jgi:hypothetical protein
MPVNIRAPGIVTKELRKEMETMPGNSPVFSLHRK